MQEVFDEVRVHLYSNCKEIFMEEVNEYPDHFSDSEAYITAT